MQVNDDANMCMSGYGRRLGSVSRAALLFSAMLVVAAFLTSGCGPSSQGNNAQGPPAAGPNEVPELSDQVIHERINDAFVREIPEENGAGDPIYWSFDQDEPKEITVVERQENGAEATIVLDIKTRSGRGVRNPRELAGQIRTEWKLKTGWVLRKWEIVGTENISMKYRNLPRLPAQNSDG